MVDSPGNALKAIRGTSLCPKIAKGAAMRCREKTLYANADVVCMDADNSRASAVLVCGDRIEAVGREEELRPLAGPRAERVDLKGACLYPGFIDSHSHLSLYAAWKPYAYCGGARSLAEALEILAGHAAGRPGDAFVVGYGFDDTAVSEKRGPLRQELDALWPDRPAALVHVSVHTAYINSRMFEILGIPTDRPSANIHIVCRDGRPTGLITEETVWKLFSALPAVSLERLKAGLQLAVADYNAQGFTATIGGGAGFGGLQPFMVARALAGLEREGKLNLHVHMPVIGTHYDMFEATGMLDGPGSPMLRPHGVKFFADGSIQAYTAALPEGYHDRPDLKPDILGSYRELEANVLAAHAGGQQVVAHGNGNGAIEAVIRAVENAQVRSPRADPRHLLIHCQTASDDQLRRMKAVGLWPSFFGLHIWNWGDRHHDIFLGPQRAARLNPCQSAVRLGLPFSLHADTPVLPQMTMLSIHTAVNRLTRGGRVLGEDQRISALDAMRAYTTHAAAMCFEENNRGSIEPGKVADFTVLSEDPCSTPPEAISRISIEAVLSAGRPVWGRW